MVAHRHLALFACTRSGRHLLRRCCEGWDSLLIDFEVRIPSFRLFWNDLTAGKTGRRSTQVSEPQSAVQRICNEQRITHHTGLVFCDNGQAGRT